MDRITIRLEAMRIASKIPGVSARNLVSTARRIERYVEGSAQLEEHFSEVEVIQKTVQEAMLEMTGSNEVIRKFEELDKKLHRMYPNLNALQDTSASVTKEPVYPYHPGMEETRENARQRHELDKALGIRPASFEHASGHRDFTNAMNQQDQERE